MRETREAPNNLPRPLTSFIGRQEDISALARALKETRLLTLVGAGGCGKTRLAREVAATALNAWPDGVWWVDLAPLTDPAHVIQTIASTLHLIEYPGEAPLDAIIRTCASSRVLLILDNCEHLIERCAQVGQELLSGCPTLTILATSRETLNIAGETVFTVPSLALPDESDSIDAIARCDAARLFTERARAAAPDFALTPETVVATVAICRRLDGMPLAIELAASRMRALSPDAIAARLATAIPLLTGGSRTALPRHQTLRATLDWSYALLPEPEARLFQRLAVFAGGFTLDAAEAVGGDEETDVLDLLGHLIDKSLVNVLREPSAHGERRYRLLEVMRQYGVEKLIASGELEATHRRHRDYFLHLAEKIEPELEGPNQVLWLNRLEQEHGNIQVALRWSIERARDDGAARLASSISRFWHIRGFLAEGRRWMQQGLELIPERNLIHAHALLMLAIGTYVHEGSEAAFAVSEEALALYRELGDTKGLGTGLLNAGVVALGREDYARAISYLEESLLLCARAGYSHGVVLSLSELGQAARALGDYQRAQALEMESIALAREAGDNHTLAGNLTDLGVTFYAQGEYARALPYFEESLALRRQNGDKGGAAHTLYYLGRFALDQARTADASAHFQESLALRLAIGDLAGQAAALEGLAALAAQAGDGVTAARRFGAATAARERVHRPVPAFDRAFTDRWLAATRELLGDEAFARELEAGRALTLSGAASALGPAIPASPASPASPISPPPAPPAGADGVRYEGASKGDGDDASARSSPRNNRNHTVHAPRAPVELRISALGAPRVYLRSHLVESADWTYSKALELLFYLLTHGPATKEAIGLALWPDADAAHVRSQLHPVLHACRRALGDADWILFEKGRYRFNRERSYSYDVAEFEAQLTEGRKALASAPDAPERAISLLENATRRYRGDFLASETGPAAGEWITVERTGLRQRWLDALTLLAGLLVSTGDHARAAGAYRRLIEADPYQEQAHRALMLLLAHTGERAQALRHYESLTRMLRTELATTPAPETAALAEALRSGAPV